MKRIAQLSRKQKTAAVLFMVMILAMPAISHASQASNAYLIGSYLTSGNTASALGIVGTVMQAGGGIGSALGLLCGVQTAILVGVGA